MSGAGRLSQRHLELRGAAVAGGALVKGPDTGGGAGKRGLEGPAQSHCKHTPLTQDSDHVRRSSVRKQTKSYVKTKNRYSSSDSQWAPSAVTSCAPGASPQTDRPPYSGPQVKLQVLLDC